MNKPKLTYEQLMYKSDLAEITAMKSETDWSYWFWKNVSEQLEEKALQCEVK